MRLEIDRKADAAYVQIHERPVNRTRELDSQRVVDYDKEGEIVGIEFLAVSNGVDLDDLPFREQLTRLFEERGIRQLV